METQETNASEYLYQGNLSRAAGSIMSGNSIIWDADQAEYALAAMCLAGRAQQAEVILKQYSQKFNRQQLVACRYYLAVGYTMSGRYKRARRYIVGNFSKRHACNDTQSLFYIWQGLAFYRFYTGRLAQGNSASTKAFAYAVSCNFTYGRMVASEVRGHIQVLMGSVSEGVTALEHASQLAQALGNQQVLKSVTIALANYEARYNLTPSQGEEKLLGVLKALPLGDPFAESSLRFEIARQLILDGKLKPAKNQLDVVQKSIYKHNHYRYSATLSIRYADWHFANGGSWEALHHIMAALKELDQSIDGLLIVEALMRKARILKVIGEKEAWQETIKSLTSLNKITNDHASSLFLNEPTSAKEMPQKLDIPKNVNHRQVKILRFLEENEFIDVSTAKTMFDVAEITVCRDLSNLVKTGHLQRVGKARATRYTRHSHEA